MSPEQFDNLGATKFGSRLPDGSPVISLMGDPTGAGGANDDTDLFVSVVPKGANGRKWAAIKADTGIPSTPAEKGASLAVRAWRSLVSFVGAEGAEVAKSDAPTTFEAALYPRKLMSAMWDGQDALHTAIRGILEDEATTDKLAAIGKALDGFKGWVIEHAKPVVAAKADDLPVLAAAAVAIGDPENGDPLAAKIGKVISKRNAGRIRGAGKAVAKALAELQALLDETGNAEDPDDDDDKAAKAATEDPMKLATALKIATLAAKAADPKATDSVIADRAADMAAKMMADPAIKEDVGEPAADLARLWAESGMAQGAGGSPTLPEAVLAAILKLPAMKSFADRLGALEATVNGTPAAKSSDGADVAAEPGLRELAEKAIELGVMNSRVLGIPSASASAHDPDAARKEAEAARKAADPDGDNDAFKGSGLGFGFGV